MGLMRLISKILFLLTLSSLAYGGNLRIISPVKGGFPTGRLGNLTVTSTTTLTACGIYDYNIITIDPGATLTFTDVTSGCWTVLGAKKIINNGTITTSGIGKFYDGSVDGFSSYTATNWVATSLQRGTVGDSAAVMTYSTGTQLLGGDNFSSNGYYGNGAGGPNPFSIDNSSGVLGAGGHGGRDECGNGNPPDSRNIGHNVYGLFVNYTTNLAAPNCGGSRKGSGGGGGSRGAHGTALYLMVSGDTSGTGVLSTAGQRGGYGGDGSTGINDIGGYGGSGGAGGSGGKLVFRRRLSAPMLWTVTAAGGLGGPAGLDGGVNGSPAGGTTYSNPGSAGFAGTVVNKSL